MGTALIPPHTFLVSGTCAVCDEHTFSVAKLGPYQSFLTWVVVPLVLSYFEKAMSQIRKFIERISQSFSVISTEKISLHWVPWSVWQASQFLVC